MRAFFLLAFALLATPAGAQTGDQIGPQTGVAETPVCLFPRGGEELDEACLDLLAATARDAPRTARITVRGFAQELQGPRLDGLINRRRADTVARELRRLGVDPDRLEVTTPAAEPRDASRRVDPRSRRVEILVGSETDR